MATIKGLQQEGGGQATFAAAGWTQPEHAPMLTPFVSSIRRVTIWLSVDFADASGKPFQRGISNSGSQAIFKPPTKRCAAGSAMPLTKSVSSSTASS